jgi:hypothetical protein
MGRCAAKEPDGKRCWRHAEVIYRCSDGLRNLCKMHHFLLEQTVAKLAELRERRSPEERERLAS